MRMADSPIEDLVVGGGVGPLPMADPPEVDTPTPPSDLEPLCDDAPIGRVVSVPHPSLPTFAAQYLSVDIAFTWRDTSYLAGRKVISADLGYDMRGTFLVLGIQVCIRPLRLRRKPSRWERGFGLFGHPGGPWPLGRFEPRSGVDLRDLLRLAELARLYERNMKPSAFAPAEVVFISREPERELREIAERLAGNG